MVEVIRRLESATAEDADAAIDRAKAVFPGWRGVEPADRARLLRRLAEARENPVWLESQNVGKPIAGAQGEITMVVETFITTPTRQGACSATRSPSRAAST